MLGCSTNFWPTNRLPDLDTLAHFRTTDSAFGAALEQPIEAAIASLYNPIVLVASAISRDLHVTPPKHHITSPSSSLRRGQRRGLHSTPASRQHISYIVRRSHYGIQYVYRLSSYSSTYADTIICRSRRPVLDAPAGCWVSITSRISSFARPVVSLMSEADYDIEHNRSHKIKDADFGLSFPLHPRLQLAPRLSSRSSRPSRSSLPSDPILRPPTSHSRQGTPEAALRRQRSESVLADRSRLSADVSLSGRRESDLRTATTAPGMNVMT